MSLITFYFCFQYDISYMLIYCLGIGINGIHRALLHIWYTGNILYNDAGVDEYDRYRYLIFCKEWYNALRWFVILPRYIRALFFLRRRILAYYGNDDQVFVVACSWECNVLFYVLSYIIYSVFFFLKKKVHQYMWW